MKYEHIPQKTGRFILSFFVVLSLYFICLGISFTATAYAGNGFFEKEYEKYRVYDDLPMEKTEVLGASSYMMSYLLGKHDDLSYTVNVDGKETDFFNDQDRFHMAEVGRMFRSVYYSMAAGALILSAFFVYMYMMTKKRGCRFRAHILAGVKRTYEIMTAGLAAVSFLLAAAAYHDFEALFVKFHLIAFDNDKWLFDPSTDYMIRMLPEGLFMDAFIRIGTGFLLMIAVFYGVILFAKKKADACADHNAN